VLAETYDEWAVAERRACQRSQMAKIGQPTIEEWPLTITV